MRFTWRGFVRAVTGARRREYWEYIDRIAQENANHRAEVEALFDELHGMLRAIPCEERFRAEWVMSEEELRRLDRILGLTLRSREAVSFGPGTKLTIFGKPIRLDDSAEGIELALRPLVAAL